MGDKSEWESVNASQSSVVGGSINSNRRLFLKRFSQTKLTFFWLLFEKKNIT